MVWVKITQEAPGLGNWAEGQVIDLPEKLVAKLVQGGNAEPTAAPQPKKQEIETAAVEVGETAVQPRPTRKRKGK